MRKSGYSKQRVDTDRIEGGYIALPHDVVKSLAYTTLSYSAKAMLIELALQYRPDRNGRLIATYRYLKPRGFTSCAVINRCVRELVDHKLIHLTVQGHRPNKASWYALTWYRLFPNDKFDFDALETFRRGLYRDYVNPLNRAKDQPIAPVLGLKD